MTLVILALVSFVQVFALGFRMIIDTLNPRYRSATA